MNLVGNAKKFTTKGHIAIGAQVSEDEKWIECVVEDTGIGIPKIWNIFSIVFIK